MKKRFAYALVSTLVLGGLVSCGNTEPSSEEPAPAPSTSETVVLPPVSAPEGATQLSIWLSKKDSKAIGALQNAWNEAHADEPIQFIASQVEEGDVGNKYTEDAEKTPDIAHVPGDVVTKLSQNELIASFTESELDVDGFDVPETVLNAAKDSSGIQYGLPFSTNTYFMYYNKSLVTAEQAKTIDGLIEAKGTTNNKVMALDIANGWYTQSFFMSAENGGIFADNGTSATETVLLNGSGLAAAKSIRKFYEAQSNYALTGDEMTSSLTSGVLSYISGSWDYSKIATAWGEDNVGMTVLPQLHLGANGDLKEWKTIGDYKSIVVSNNSKHKQLAKKVAVFLDSKVGQQLRFNANEGSTAPTSKSLLADEEFKKSFKFAGVMDEVMASNYFIQNTSTKFGNWWNNAGAFCNGVKEDVAAGKLQDADLTARLTALNTALLA